MSRLVALRVLFDKKVSPLKKAVEMLGFGRVVYSRLWHDVQMLPTNLFSPVNREILGKIDLDPDASSPTGYMLNTFWIFFINLEYIP